MLPVKRTSRARRNNRRSHHALCAAHTVVCPNCGSPKRPHAACGNCGYVRPGLSLRQDEE
jgi:large subunit ribosomal protein L32